MKTRNIIWTIAGILLMIVVVYATTTVTDTEISLTSLDSIISLQSFSSLLGGSPSSGGIFINQTRPEAKGGIWWYSWDNPSQKNRITGWIVCHYNSSANSDPHSHCAIETLDNTTGTPSINTHFAISYGSGNTKAVTSVYSSDFEVSNLAYLNTTGSSKFTPATTFNVYPNGQSTYALQVSNTTTAVSFSALGTPDFQFAGDNVTITQLAGTGNAVACINANGKLYRGNATGCP